MRTEIPVKVKPQPMVVSWQCAHCPERFHIEVVKVEHSKPLRTGQHASQAMVTLSISEEAMLDRVQLHVKECRDR